MALDAPLVGQHAVAIDACPGTHRAAAAGRCRRDVTLELPLEFGANADSGCICCGQCGDA